MTRQERNRLRKKRAKAKGFALLACMLLFLIGVYKTYDVMQTALGLKTNESVLSFGNKGQVLSELTSELTKELPSISKKIKNILIQLFSQLQYILDYLWRWFGTLISS